MKILIVGGNFDSLRGSPSKVISKLYAAFENEIDEPRIDCEFVEIINGGTIDDLLNVNFKNYDVLLWAPNISNDEEKIIPNIKSINPRLTLISTKRVVEKHYQESDVIGRLLKSKSNLGIMITKDDLYNFKLLDPLGNCYADTTDIEELSGAILKRIVFVKSLNRVGCKRVGDKREVVINHKFLEFVRHSASEFTKHVNAVNPNRLLGNASTRCMFGFPAEKCKDRIFVTQRNIDKELIENNGFVEVTDREDMVEYYGDKKPSVDTPIQIRLFNYYDNINYMVHGHVYVDSEEFTDNKIPCGFVEEFDEIVDLHPSKDERVIAVNLKGHGCILMADTVDELWEMGSYVSREFPEY